ncbi:hypothetical protein [Conexibacter sp. DBS9H8]|uniref:hypothetical protein n=1 Tax=Conexibacter sp. DBS9H8 TaxID=2937801 RepID=UPI00273A6E91|nr:hypothetical protein [Conexibacter sp. DBS9H8]
MRLSPRLRTLAGALILTVALAGCGSSGRLLSAGAATQLDSDLSQASTALNDFNCPAARAALTNFANNVSALQGVNATLVQMLGQGVSEVRSLAQARCPSGGATVTNPPRTVTTSTQTRTHTTETTTRTNPVTTTTTTASETATNPPTTTNGSGGAAPATTTAPPTTTVAPPPVTTVDSGGAGLAGGAPGGGPGGAG